MLYNVKYIDKCWRVYNRNWWYIMKTNMLEYGTKKNYNLWCQIKWNTILKATEYKAKVAWIQFPCQLHPFSISLTRFFLSIHHQIHKKTEHTSSSVINLLKNAFQDLQTHGRQNPQSNLLQPVKKSINLRNAKEQTTPIHTTQHLIISKKRKSNLWTKPKLLMIQF